MRYNELKKKQDNELEQFVKDAISEHGSVLAASFAVGMHRRTMQRIMERLGIEQPNPRQTEDAPPRKTLTYKQPKARR